MLVMQVTFKLIENRLENIFLDDEMFSWDVKDGRLRLRRRKEVF